MEATVCKMPGKHMKLYLLISVHILEGQVSLGDFSKRKRAGAGACHFSPPSPSLNTWTPAETMAAPTFYTYLVNSTPTHAFSCRPAPSNTPLTGVHPNHCQSLAVASSPDGAVPLQSNSFPGERGIYPHTHTSPAAAPKWARGRHLI